MEVCREKLYAVLIETMNVCVLTGKESLRVDCVLGEGAFATVYQATNPATLEKTVLKVRLQMKSAASLSLCYSALFFLM